jgi:hypothetical protein
MDIERSLMSRMESTIRQAPIWSELPPAQAGVAAALRRAFVPPCDETERQFAELLSKLG